MKIIKIVGEYLDIEDIFSKNIHKQSEFIKTLEIEPLLLSSIIQSSHVPKEV
jgi:hypothetical protein